MEVYTTGEVAKICTVATTTVNKWFDSGQLKGFRVPGSRHRRIPRKQLLEFLRNHHLPLGPLEHDERITVLLVSRDSELAVKMRQTIHDKDLLDVLVTPSAFEAGLLAEETPPDCIVVDFGIGYVEAQQVCQTLKSDKGDLQATVIAVVSPGSETSDVERAGVGDIFTRPFDTRLLAERIETLVRASRFGG